MKKIYLLAASIAMCTAGTAQIGVNSDAQIQRSFAGQSAATQADRPESAPASTSNSRNTILWEDDFSDPSTWIFTDQSPTPYGWEIVTGPYNASIQAGTPFESFMSTTADNGYAFIDSDGSPWTSDGSGEVIGQIRTATAIDLSEEPSVLLRYENNYRWFNDTRGVRVSADNGETWTDYDLTDANGYPNEQDSENPDIVEINVSNVIGGASEALIEFYYRDNNIWAWYWSVDDVSLCIPEDNNISVSAEKYAGYDSEVDENWLNVEYAIYDINQLRELQFSATATNNGALPQTGVYMEVNINNGAGEDVTLQTDPVDLAVNESVEFVIDGYTPPAELGMYDVTYTLIQNEEESFPDDNVAMRSFEISDGSFARDRDGVAFFSNVGLGEFWGGPGYYMTEEATLHCIGAAIANTSVVGTFYDMELRDGLDIAFLAATETGQVEEDDLNGGGEENFTYQWMENPTTLFAGDDYVVMFHHFGGADEAAVGISENTAPDFTSYVWASFEDQECDPCYTGSTFMVRMGLSEEFCSSMMPNSVEEIEQVSVSDLFPNPTAGQTVLEYAVLEASEVQIFLFDNQGRIVMNKDMGTQPVGEYRYDYDFSDLAAGQYMLSIHVNEKSVNKKLVIR